MKSVYVDCPFCQFGMGTYAPTKNDIDFNWRKVEGTPLRYVSYRVESVGVRRCKKCKRWFVLVTCPNWNWIWGLSGFGYHPEQPEPQIGREVSRYAINLLHKEGKKIPKDFKKYVDKEKLKMPEIRWFKGKCKVEVVKKSKGSWVVKALEEFYPVVPLHLLPSTKYYKIGEEFEVDPRLLRRKPK